MIPIQAVKSVWSTLHKVLLQTAGNEQWGTERSTLCLEKKKGENGAAERTQDAFSLNFSVQFQPRATNYKLLSSATPPPFKSFLYSEVILTSELQIQQRLIFNTDCVALN